MGGRSKDRKDIFETDARLGKIRCLGDCLLKITSLRLAFGLDALYLSTGEFGGCDTDVSISRRLPWLSVDFGSLEVVAWDSGREEP